MPWENENENPTYQNLWDVEIGGGFIATNGYQKKL